MAEVRTCPSCSEDVPSAAAFCPHCGAANEDASTELEQGAGPAGEEDPTERAPASAGGAEDPTQVEPAAPAGFTLAQGSPDPPAGEAEEAAPQSSEADDRTRVDLPVNDPTAAFPRGATKTDGSPPPPPVWSDPAPPQPSPPPVPPWSSPTPSASSPPAWEQGASLGTAPPLAPPGTPPPYQGIGGSPYAATAAAGAPPPKRRRRSIAGGLLGIIGGAAAIVAVFLEWLQVTFPGGAESAANGFDATDDARIALGIGIGAVVVGLLLFVSRFVLLRLALLAAGVGALAIFVRDVLDAPRLRDAIGADSHTVGIGLFVLAGAGAVMLLGGLVSFIGGSTEKS